MPIEYEAIRSKTADDAIQHADAAGRGVAILLDGPKVITELANRLGDGVDGRVIEPGVLLVWSDCVDRCAFYVHVRAEKERVSIFATVLSGPRRVNAAGRTRESGGS